MSNTGIISRVTLLYFTFVGTLSSSAAGSSMAHAQCASAAAFLKPSTSAAGR